YRADLCRSGRDVGNGVDTGSLDCERHSRAEVHDAAQLPLADEVLEPARSLPQQVMAGAERQFVRSVAADLVHAIEILKLLALVTIVRIGKLVCRSRHGVGRAKRVASDVGCRVRKALRQSPCQLEIVGLVDGALV